MQASAGHDVSSEEHAASVALELGRLQIASGAAVLMADRNGVLEYLSPGAQTLFNCSNNALIGSSLWALFPDAALAERAATLEKAAGESVQYVDLLRVEIDCLAVGGRSIPAEVSVYCRFCRFDAEEIPNGFAVVVCDIAERRRKENKLRVNEERLALAMTVANDGLFDWDVATNEIYFDDRYYTMAGYEPDEFAGNFEEFVAHVNPEDFVRTQVAIRAYLEGRVQEYDEEFRFLRKDQTWMWIRARVKVVERDDSGAGTRLIGTHTEITEQKRAQEEKNDLEEQLRQAHKMEAIGLLAGGVAHDFNNMLSAILCTAQMAQKKVAADSELATSFDEIIAASGRAAELTQQLLAFSRKQIIQPKATQLDALVAGLLPMLARTLGEDILLKSDSKGHSWLVLVDPGQIEQVILNLAINARDAMPSGGELHIGTAELSVDSNLAASFGLDRPGDYVELFVRDTGTGMDPTTQTKIFDPFFTTKDVGRGTGLGLASVLGSVEQNGGTLVVTSELGNGSTFAALFPRAYSSHGDDTTSAARFDARQPCDDETPGRAAAETVLVVEDEKLVRRVAVMILERAGYRVLSACSGVEALSLAQDYDERIDLLLSDVVMPHMGGPALAEKLTALRPDIKVLFVSGYSEDAVVSSGVPILRKPYSVESLVDRVREILDGAIAQQR